MRDSPGAAYQTRTANAGALLMGANPAAGTVREDRSARGNIHFNPNVPVSSSRTASSAFERAASLYSTVTPRSTQLSP